MELIVFDLDGTLLNRQQRISDFTRETLHRLGERHVAYTVATGRTLHAARPCLEGHEFALPHVYKNGVMIWDPTSSLFRHSNMLTKEEIDTVLQAFAAAGLTPFVCTLEPNDEHAVYHPPILDAASRDLVQKLGETRNLPVLPLTALDDQARITNISALGPEPAIRAIADSLTTQEHLIAYLGDAMYQEGVFWMDIHHSAATKGGALELLKAELGFERIICFGDGENDLSMFALADECYAPDNATADIKRVATEVIGHHDQDGIAHFLRDRFRL